MSDFPSNSLKNYRKQLQKMITAIDAIKTSDMLVNVISRKLDKNLIAKHELTTALESITKTSAHEYVQSLFVINSITLLEVYLKDRIIEELNLNEKAIITFLRTYETNKKINTEDIINGPLVYSTMLVDEIIFHNLPKVEKVYRCIFDIDVKKMADFKKLNLAVKVRHSFVHEAGTARGKNNQVNNVYLVSTINEISKFVENIDFFIKNKSLKAKHIDYYRKNGSKDLFSVDDEVNYVWGE